MGREATSPGPSARPRSSGRGSGGALQAPAGKGYVEVANRASQVVVVTPDESERLVASVVARRATDASAEEAAAEKATEARRTKPGAPQTAAAADKKNVDYKEQSAARDRLRLQVACGTVNTISRAEILACQAEDALEAAAKETLPVGTVSRIVQVCLRCFLMDVEGRESKSAEPMAPEPESEEEKAADSEEVPDAGTVAGPSRDAALNHASASVWPQGLEWPRPPAPDRDPAGREYQDDGLASSQPQCDFFRPDAQQPPPPRGPRGRSPSPDRGDAAVKKIHTALGAVTAALEVQHRVLLQFSRGNQPPLPRDHESRSLLTAAHNALGQVRGFFDEAAEAMKDRGDCIEQLRCELNVCKEKLLTKETDQWARRRTLISHQAVLHWQRLLVRRLRDRVKALTQQLATQTGAAPPQGPPTQQQQQQQQLQQQQAAAASQRSAAIQEQRSEPGSPAKEKEKEKEKEDDKDKAQEATPMAFLVCCLDSVHRLRALHRSDRTQPVEQALDLWYDCLESCADAYRACSLLQPVKMFGRSDAARDDGLAPSPSRPAEAFEAEGYALLCFPTALDAAQFACSLHSVLLALPWPEELLNNDHPVCPPKWHATDAPKTKPGEMRAAFHQEFGADQARKGAAARWDVSRFDEVAANLIASRGAPPFGIKREGLVFRGPRARVGIHFGAAPHETVQGHAHFYGDVVMKASLLCAKARGGETLLSSSVYQSVKKDLVEGSVYHAPVPVVDPSCVAIDWRRATDEQREVLQSLDLLCDSNATGPTSMLFEPEEPAWQIFPMALCPRAGLLSEVTDAWEHELCDYNPNWWLRYNNLPSGDLRAIAQRRAQQAVQLCGGDTSDVVAEFAIGGSAEEQVLREACVRLKRQVDNLEADYEEMRVKAERKRAQQPWVLSRCFEEQLLGAYDIISAATARALPAPEQLAQGAAGDAVALQDAERRIADTMLELRRQEQKNAEQASERERQASAAQSKHEAELQGLRARITALEQSVPPGSSESMFCGGPGAASSADHTLADGAEGGGADAEEAREGGGGGERDAAQQAAGAARLAELEQELQRARAEATRLSEELAAAQNAPRRDSDWATNPELEQALGAAEQLLREHLVQSSRSPRSLWRRVSQRVLSSQRQKRRRTAPATSSLAASDNEVPGEIGALLRVAAHDAATSSSQMQSSVAGSSDAISSWDSPRFGSGPAPASVGRSTPGLSGTFGSAADGGGEPGAAGGGGSSADRVMRLVKALLQQLPSERRHSSPVRPPSAPPQPGPPPLRPRAGSRVVVPGTEGLSQRSQQTKEQWKKRREVMEQEQRMQAEAIYVGGVSSPPGGPGLVPHLPAASPPTAAVPRRPSTYGRSGSVVSDALAGSSDDERPGRSPSPACTPADVPLTVGKAVSFRRSVSDLPREPTTAQRGADPRDLLRSDSLASLAAGGRQHSGLIRAGGDQRRGSRADPRKGSEAQVLGVHRHSLSALGMSVAQGPRHTSMRTPRTMTLDADSLEA